MCFALSEACKGRTERIQGNQSLTSWASFKRVTQTVEMDCCGLSDESWKRERAKYTITNCAEHSPMPYHGAKRWNLCYKLFGTTHEIQLTAEQKKKLHRALEANAIWRFQRHGEQASIHSTQCARKLECRSGTVHPICNNCELLKKNRGLLRAINSPYARDDNIKYIPKVLMTGDKFQAVLIRYVELQTLQKSLERSTADGDKAFWTAIGTYGKAGLFKNNELVRGLMTAVGVRAERESRGKSFRGKRIDIYLDNFLTTLASISSCALKLFNDNFAGRSARSMRQIRRNSGMHLEDGLHSSNFEKIAAILEELDYTGPLAAGTDETVCVKSLRHYNGFIVGAEGGDITFVEGKDIEAIVKSTVAKGQLCSKVNIRTPY